MCWMDGRDIAREDYVAFVFECAYMIVDKEGKMRCAIVVGLL